MSLTLASRSPYKVETSVFWPLPGCLSVASDLCNLFMWKLIINKNMREEKIGLYITLRLIFSVIKTGWLYRASENLLKNISHVICFSFLIYGKEQQRVGFFCSCLQQESEIPQENRIAQMSVFLACCQRRHFHIYLYVHTCRYIFNQALKSNS